MQKSDDQDRRKSLESVRSSLGMLAFGFFMLAFLVAIDRPEWFNLRPVSGTAAAMSKASHAASHDQQNEAQAEGRDSN